MIENELEFALHNKNSLTQEDINSVESKIRLRLRESKPQQISKKPQGQPSDVQLPMIKKENTLKDIETNSPTHVGLKPELFQGPRTNKAMKYRTGFNSINQSPRALSPMHNHSTLEPSVYQRHRDLIRGEDHLSGITASNEWDEIWKFAKIKEQEENAIKKHKKLAQKIQFNNDLRAQIMDNEKRKRKEIEERKQKEKEMVEALERKLRTEDTKKMMSKMLALDSKTYNDNILSQKNKNKKELFEQRRSYEKSLLERGAKELETERKQSLLKKIELRKENGRLIEQSQMAKIERQKLKREEKMQDKKYSDEYSKLFERQEEAKAKIRGHIRSVMDNQPTSLPTEREKNILGLSVQEEERQMVRKMKAEEAQAKATQYLNKVSKLQVGCILVTFWLNI